MKPNFDEMQEKKRDRIGNQSFLLLVILLMADNVLYTLGVRWVAYPTNVFLIAVCCCGIFVVRSILAGSFLAPNQSVRSGASKTALVLAFSMAAAMILANLVMRKAPNAAEAPADGGAVVLFVVSWGFLVVALLAFVIKRIRDKKDGD